MKRLLLAISLFLLPLPLLAATDGQMRTYLHNQSVDAWVAMARGAIGDSVPPASLRILPTGSANDLSKFILALVANSVNPRTFYGHDYILDLLAQVSGNQVGNPQALNDDAWGLLALRAGGLDITHLAVMGVKNNLLLTQNTDGGWGYAVGGRSDTNDTAAVMMALSEAGVPSGDVSFARALAYLSTQQNDDGGFSYNHGEYATSDGASDAWVIAALTKVGSNLGMWKKNGVTVVDHLRSLARADGCFAWQKSDASCSAGISAWATIALEGRSYPVRGVWLLDVPGQIALPQAVSTVPATTSPLLPVIIVPGGIASSVGSTKESQQTITVPPVISPASQDSDGDGYPDVVELLRGYDPHDPVPCLKVVYSTTLKNSYGGARLASAENEACRAQYVRRELTKMLGARLKLSSRAFGTLVNAFVYGGYTLKDIAMSVKGGKTVHPTIRKEVWVQRNK
ncbi:terpene cyclase/mutase family protein [Candidatus Uhrbacteria bacterium]|nr:terpene cyclase/mutase family protein [Candidatus Uhrbacteria bacterium]